MSPKDTLQSLCLHIIEEGISKDPMTTNRQYATIVERNRAKIESLTLKLKTSEIIDVAETFDTEAHAIVSYVLLAFCKIIAEQVVREKVGNELERFSSLIQKLCLEDLDILFSGQVEYTDSAEQCIRNEYDRRSTIPPTALSL